jgi:Asp-tRNA(Asn)/Glu-tRNA(Gln) amidotransferase A subunit family amidase
MCHFGRKLILDDPEVYHGGPVGLQLVGRRLREEDVLEMAEILETALKKA